MERFPKLKTGAIAQYPTQRLQRFRTEIGMFLDGSEQRYRDRMEPGKRWVIELTQLDEGEAAELWDFFRKQRGRTTLFEFEDPMSGELLNNCRFDENSASMIAREEFDSGLRFVVAEAIE